MNRNLLFMILAGLFFVQAVTPPPNKPIAIIELFTSQGCSSCPPADRLLTEISQQAAANGQDVYALSFHVDIGIGSAGAIRTATTIIPSGKNNTLVSSSSNRSIHPKLFSTVNWNSSDQIGLS